MVERSSCVTFSPFFFIFFIFQTYVIIDFLQIKFRYEIFKDNLKYIDEHNAAADAGVHSFRLGLNRFADLTNEEYRATYLGTKPVGTRRGRVGDRYKVGEGESLPDSIDWREKGAVAEVKDQGSCG